MRAVRLAALTLTLLGAPAALAASPTGGAKTHQVLVLLRLPPDHVHADGGYADSYGDGAAQAARRRIAAGLAHDMGLSLVTSWPMPLLSADCFVLEVPPGRSVEEVAAQLARDPRVLGAEPMHDYRTEGKAAPPNDPLFAMQPAAIDWRLADLHTVASGRNVWVAVIDSRVQADHPDLAGQIQISRDFVLNHPGAPEQHGTGVAGVIAAIADNHVGIAGVAPHARLMALRACWQQPASAGTICDTLSLAKALHFAIDNRAQVINLSLSGPPDVILGALLDQALVRGITVVGAADAAGGGFPASHPGVVAVTDDEALARNAYLAPGRDVPTTQPSGRWFLVNGSSYAAAHVSGLFALMRERNPHAESGASLVASGGRTGAIDACATLAAAGICPCDCGRPASARP